MAVSLMLFMADHSSWMVLWFPLNMTLDFFALKSNIFPYIYYRSPTSRTASGS